jgi:hypothetical protein
MSYIGKNKSNSSTLVSFLVHSVGFLGFRQFLLSLIVLFIVVLPYYRRVRIELIQNDEFHEQSSQLAKKGIGKERILHSTEKDTVVRKETDQSILRNGWRIEI